MSREPINHPAYPVNPYEGDTSNPPVRSNSGASIRDYFAKAALQAIASEKLASEPEAAAEMAYAFADAMLEERQYTTRK
jgi:hypothetical protein